LNKGDKMKPSIINLTPHNIFEVESGINFPASGKVARISSTSEVMYFLEQDNGLIPVYKTCFGEVQGLPENPVNGTFYIVSGIVLSAMPNRWDLLAPGELVRDGNGNPVGCRGFRTN
jgi:hypothetical protein